MIEHISARQGLKLRTRLGRLLAKHTGRQTLAPNHPLEVQRARMDRAADILPLPSGVAIGAGELAGCTTLTFAPKDARVGHLLYLHGGGYSRGSARSHRGLVARMAGLYRLDATSLNYRLAPEHACPAAVEDAVSGFMALAEKTEGPIILAGDSAGGGLALAAALRLRAAGGRVPAALILFSPWVDLTMSGSSADTLDLVDPMLKTGYLKAASAAYARDPLSADASPLFADLSGLPPCLIQVGSDEVLLDDSTRLAAHLTAAGVANECEVWDGLWHDFALFAPLLPEAGLALNRSRDWLERQLASSQA